jgi:hypothetical protein
MLRGNWLDDARRFDVDARIAAYGGVTRWRVSPKFERAYALVEFSDDTDIAALRLGATIDLGSPTIALAVSPTVSEALPVLAAVLGGAGRPAGIVSCERAVDALIIEWDLEKTSAGLILDSIDTELDRFHSGRVTELLTPLSDAWLSKIAAEGLECADIAPDRILEALVAQAGLGSADV